jgi:metal-responsive CopG/Arc/MetJ family transcriptional regulator
MGKTSITIQLDSKVIAALEKRAKKEMLELSELISEILRRSAVSYTGKASGEDGVDDKFLTYFSRKEKVDYAGKLTGKKKSKKIGKPFYESPLKK